MREIHEELTEKTRALVAKVPARLIYAIRRSTPNAYFRALPLAGIHWLSITSLSEARRARRLGTTAELVLAVKTLTAASIAEAYRDLRIRAFRVSRRDQIHLLVNTLGGADDLTIIVDLPNQGAVGLWADPAGDAEVAAMLTEARHVADILGLGYDAGKESITPDDHRSRIEGLRHAVITAAVTVDLIEIAGGGPITWNSYLQEVTEAFESLPISYSAELWLRPDPTYFDQALLRGWSEQGEDDSGSRRDSETFFISYATEQESIAKEVVSIIESRGHDSIVQFRDFAQVGFVRSMREGIERADRFVALQSKQYWKSDHCQAEWDAAFARDPGGKKRFIVPFLVEPAPLPPIASELVYKSLVGLNARQRRTAIEEWIDYTPQPRSRSQLRRALATQASPDVRMHEARLDAGPNARVDRPFVDEDLVDLPSNLRAIIDALLDALPRNAPPVVRSCLSGYRRHLIERGTQPILGTVVPFAEAIQAQSTADAGQWDAGLETLFRHFHRRHELLIAHFPLNPERELLFRETVVDETRASGAQIIEPVVLVGDAVAQLREAGLTTQDFDNVEQAHQEFGRDVASLPMPSETDTASVTPKRRYVLGTIGFYERMLAAVGGLASIGGIIMVPSVHAAVASAVLALRTAIEALMRLII